MLTKRIIDCRKKQNLDNFISDFERGWNKKTDKANYWIFNNREFNTKTDFKKYLKSIKKISNIKSVIKENKKKIEKNILVGMHIKPGKFIFFENRKIKHIFKNRREFEKNFDIWNTDFEWLDTIYYEYTF